MVRLSLAALLVLQPLVHAAELAPVDVLLTRAIPQDKAALATSGPEKGERLAKLQSDLALVAEGLEGFASAQDAEPSLKRLRESVDAPEPFKDRAAALDATYRALAVVDYTWAKRLPDAGCSPEASRARLLKSGTLLAWIGTLLGPGSAGAAAKLDQASSAAKISPRKYALLRAKVHKATEALGSDKAVGAKRAALYCLRAETFEALSSANRAESGLTVASRSDAGEIDGVYVLARKTPDGLEVLGAATAINSVLVTDGRLADGDGLVVLRRGGKSLIPVQVERREPAGLALLRADEPIIGYVLSDVAPTKDALIEAIGHPDRMGAWTRTRGLVTSVDSASFQTDAVIDVGMAGGAALAEDGRLAGVFVLRQARNGGESFDWPVAVAAPALKGWLLGEALTVAPVQIAEAGSASILTASRPLVESLTPGAGATQAGYEFTEGNIHARCMANCGDARSSSGSSYGSNGGKELGDALGAAVAPLVEAMIFKGIPALFRGIGSLFKSKPNSGAIASAPKAPTIVQAEAPRQLPPEEPVRIVGLDLTADPVDQVAGGSIQLVATLRFNRTPDSPMPASIEFMISGTKDSKLGTFTAVSQAGSNSAASFVFDLPEDELLARFDDLHREERRRRGEAVEHAYQSQRAAKSESDKVKNRSGSADDALDSEEVKIAVGAGDASENQSHPESFSDRVNAAAVIPVATQQSVLIANVGAHVIGSRVFSTNIGIRLLPKLDAVSRAGTKGKKGGNHVSIHVQPNGEKGRLSWIAGDTAKDADRAMATDLLLRVERDTRRYFKNSPMSLFGFDKAVEKTRFYVDTFTGTPLSRSFTFGKSDDYRLDIEIHGHYPYRGDEEEE